MRQMFASYEFGGKKSAFFYYGKEKKLKLFEI